MSMHIGHVAFRTPEPQTSSQFLQQILGLRETLSEPDRVFLSCNERHHEVEYLRGDRPGLDHLGLEVDDEAELDALRTRLAAEGVELVDDRASEPGIDSALRFVGPMGVLFEVYAAMAREPYDLEHHLRPVGRRLGHVTFTADDLDETLRFLCDVLGFRVSDTAGQFAWLRCDAEHHGIGVNATGQNTVHHYAFQLGGIGELQQYADHLARLGWPLLWGIGRHGPGHNLFTYVADPSNAVVECYADLLTILDDAHYVPIDWFGRHEAMTNLWGPAPPAGWRDFGVPILDAQATTEGVRHA